MVQLSITSIQGGEETFLEMVEYGTKSQALNALALSGEQKYRLSKEGAVLTNPAPGLEVLLELKEMEGYGGMLLSPRIDTANLSPDPVPESPGLISKAKHLLKLMKGGQDG